MSLKGFTPVPSTQTYHHTPGKVRGYAEVDRGYKNYLQDEDPRDGFIRMGNSQVILGTDPDKELSFKSKFQRGTEICLVHEWSDQSQEPQEKAFLAGIVLTEDRAYRDVRQAFFALWTPRFMADLRCQFEAHDRAS